jgi:hypothetical protein
MSTPLCDHPGYQEEEEEIARTISDFGDEPAGSSEEELAAAIITVNVTHSPGAGTRGRRAVEG